MKDMFVCAHCGYMNDQSKIAKLELDEETLKDRTPENMIGFMKVNAEHFMVPSCPKCHCPILFMSKTTTVTKNTSDVNTNASQEKEINVEHLEFPSLTKEEIIKIQRDKGIEINRQPEPLVKCAQCGLKVKQSVMGGGVGKEKKKLCPKCIMNSLATKGR